MTTDNEWMALARYVAGECSPDERETMRRWIAEDEARTRLVLEMELIGRASVLDRGEWDARAGWERVQVRAQSAHRAAAAAPAPARRAITIFASGGTRRGRRAAWAMAAAVLLAVGALYGVRRYVPRAPRIATAGAARVFSTRRAQVAEVRLGDGTIVSLAPESRLLVPAEYGAADRTVSLDGEGYFRAAHDSLRPFIVRTGRGVVRDLGTAFVVRSYPSDATMRVVVTEGRVRVRPIGAPPASGPVLERGDLAQLSRDEAPLVEHGIDVGQYLGWTQGRLVFYRAPLSDVVEQLGRWYDIPLVLEDSSLRTRRVTMAVSTASPDALVGAMSAMLGLQAERRGDTIALRAATPTASGGQQP